MVVSVGDHPQLDLVPKDNQRRGEQHGQQGRGDKQQRHQPLLPKGELTTRQPVGAAKAFHER